METPGFCGEGFSRESDVALNFTMDTNPAPGFVFDEGTTISHPLADSTEKRFAPSTMGNPHLITDRIP